ncbi:hypothetical protein T439DRAFT_137007 [Meredithblackwellia eburnea MCA 4105]
MVAAGPIHILARPTRDAEVELLEGGREEAEEVWDHAQGQTRVDDRTFDSRRDRCTSLFVRASSFASPGQADLNECDKNKQTAGMTAPQFSPNVPQYGMPMHPYMAASPQHPGMYAAGAQMQPFPFPTSQVPIAGTASGPSSPESPYRPLPSSTFYNAPPQAPLPGGMVSAAGAPQPGGFYQPGFAGGLPMAEDPYGAMHGHYQMGYDMSGFSPSPGSSGMQHVALHPPPPPMPHMHSSTSAGVANLEAQAEALSSTTTTGPTPPHMRRKKDGRGGKDDWSLPGDPDHSDPKVKVS